MVNKTVWPFKGKKLVDQSDEEAGWPINVKKQGGQSDERIRMTIDQFGKLNRVA
jgi:hypothetical protein